MANDFSVQLGASIKLNTLDTQIKDFFKDKVYTIKVVADTTALESLKLDSITGTSVAVKGDSAANATKTANAVADLSTKISNLVTQKKLATESAAKFNAELRQIQASFAKNNNINEFNRSLNQLKNNLSETTIRFQEQKKTEQKASSDKAVLARQVNSVTNQYNSLSQALLNAKTKGQITEEQFNSLKATTDNLFETYKNDAGKVDRAFTNFENGVKGVRNEMSGLQAETAAHSQDLDKILVKYLRWFLLAGAVNAVFNSFRRVISEVKNLDAALVELNKVSDLTKSQLKDVTNWSFKMGEQVGKVGTEVLGAITNFKRAGYTLEESKQLAETALIMTNVAEGITDAGTAANYLVSILKGANLEISYSSTLLDELNEISNTSAVNFDSLANMTQRIAGTMKTLGNSVEETMALVTGAYEVLQDERVAKGLSTIGLRIAGLNDDLEREAGLQSSVNKALEKYAGISIFDTTGQLRDTYDILTELAGVWDKLNVNVQTYLTTTLAGKNRADVLAAVLNNWEGVESAMASAMDSAGSALQEQQAYLDSIEGKQQAIANMWQELSDKALDSDVVKFLLDATNATLKFVDATGGLLNAFLLLAGIGYGAAGVIAYVNATKTANVAIIAQTLAEANLNKEKLTGTAESIAAAEAVNIQAKANYNLAAAQQVAAKSAMGLKLALGAIAAVAAIVIGVVSAIVNAQKERAEAEEEARQAAIENNQATLDKLKEVRAEYTELYNKTNRTADEEKKLLDIQKSLVQNYGELEEGLDGVNGSYEKYIGLISKAELEQKKQKLALMEKDYRTAQVRIKQQDWDIGRTENLVLQPEYFGEYVLKGFEGSLSDAYKYMKAEFGRLQSKQLTGTLTGEEAEKLTKFARAIEYYEKKIAGYNETIKNYEDLQKDVNKGIQAQNDGTEEYNAKLEALVANLTALANKQEERLEQAKEEQENLKKQEKLQSALLKVEQARLGVAEARNKKMRVFRAGRGFVYEADESELESAQKTLTEALQSLSEYKYEMALENAENFVNSLSSTLTSPGIVAGWANLMEKFGDSFNDEFSDIIESAKEFVREFNETIGETGEKIPWSTSTPTPEVNGAYASGTLSAAGGLSLVGEKGPELRMLNQGDGIIPARQTAKLLKMASGEGTGTIIKVDKVEIIEPNNFDGFVSQFCSKLQLPTGGSRAPLGSY